MARASSKTPPSCFGEPERCDACAGCGLRITCYEKHARERDVFLLPLDRPAPEHRAGWGSPYAKPYEKPKGAKA